MSNREPNFSKARNLMILAYVFSIAAAVGTAYLLKESHPLICFGVADVVGTLVIFAFSYFYDNSSFYDAYWSVAPMVIALGLFFFWAVPDVEFIRQILALIVVFAWGIRLTFNWYRGWTGLAHQDWRYVDLQKQHGKAYWLVSFSGIHMFPTVLVFMGCIPLYASIALGTAPIGVLDILGFLIGMTGFFFEFFADNQLRHFVLTNKEKGKILKTGIWAYSRHPNYFGEILFWWGIFLLGYTAKPEWWYYHLAGALSITCLFIFISIPMIDKRSLERRPNYAEHMKKVPGLIPNFFIKK